MRELNEWFIANRRDFPWRRDPTPYKVWVSEVMLQQTRASVVIPYFEKWMELFPDVETLGSASLESVIKCWEGLGYYSRARNLHLGAKEIIDRFGGKIPSRREDLMTIRGLGPYTIGAILSFGFKKKAAAVDGNVTRVLSRFFCIEENVCKAPVKRKIAKGAEALLDHEEPWITAEALIELGATICTPKPRCDLCPLQENCLGREKADLLPIKNQEKEITYLKRAVILLECEEKVLIKKGEKGKIMADLYEFPYFEMDDIWSFRKIISEIEKTFCVHAEMVEKLKIVTHTFTRYKAHLYPIRFKVQECKEIEGYNWVEKDELLKLPFSSGHRRILSL